MNIDYSKKTAQIVKATPKLVDDLLKLNTQNRNIKRGHLNWIQDAIKRNDYHLTTQAIGVSDKGVLLDGQHRLMAIKNSGYPPVELLLVTGLSEEARIYIDQGEGDSPTPFVENRMASCKKCGARIKKKRNSDGLRHCKRHGPITDAGLRVSTSRHGLVDGMFKDSLDIKEFSSEGERK